MTTDKETIQTLHKALLDIRSLCQSCPWEYNALMHALDEIMKVSGKALEKIDA